MNAHKADFASALKRLDALFEPWNRADEPGLTVGLSMRGSVIYRRGFGMASIESGRSNSPSTRMRIGSTTKHFTALLALLLAEDGLLDLDNPIRRYVPELEGPGGDASIRLLLQHRGGSRCYLDLGFMAHGTALAPLGRVLAMQSRQRSRNFEPGQAAIYNNGGYQMVSLAIERAGAAPFEQQMKARLLDPLGMRDTASVPSDYSVNPGMATMHVQQADGAFRRGIFPSEELRGDGAIVSTVDDMLRWTDHLRTRDRFGSAESWNALVERPRFDDGVLGPYALGLMVGRYRGARIVHHAGGVIGGSSQMLTFPDDGLDVVVICNRTGGVDPSALAERVADIILGDGLKEPAKPIDATRYEAILGEWWSADTGMVYGLRNETGALGLALCGSSKAYVLSDAEHGQALLSNGAIGDIHLDLGAAVESGALPIRFGGRTSQYQRLAARDLDIDADSRRVEGRYYSDDGDCTATIERQGDRLTGVFSDPVGMSRADLKFLTSAVALADRTVETMPFPMVLNFGQERGRCDRFEVNTPRTRHLVFRRTGA